MIGAEMGDQRIHARMIEQQRRREADTDNLAQAVAQLQGAETVEALVGEGKSRVERATGWQQSSPEPPRPAAPRRAAARFPRNGTPRPGKHP